MHITFAIITLCLFLQIIIFAIIMHYYKYKIMYSYIIITSSLHYYYIPHYFVLHLSHYSCNITS